MFSARSRFDRTPNRFGERLGRERASGRHLLDLTQSNPTACGFRHLEAAAAVLREALAGPGGLVYAPEPAGTEAARRAVAAYYAAHGARVDPDRIFLTASTSEAYGLLFKLLADDGDALLAPRPSYPLFAYLAGLEGVAMRPYPLAAEDRFRIEPPAVAGALRATGPADADASPRARAILLVSPNNPTGTAASAAELRGLDELGARHGLAVIADEVFADFAWDAAAPAPVLAAPAARAALTFSLSGLSKVCGLPQVKLAWIAIGGPETLVAEARARLELIADTYLSVATPVQTALPALLAGRSAFLEECRARLRTNLAALDARLAAAPSVRRLPADGGWYACLRVPRIEGEEELVLRLLEEDGVVVHPGYFFDFAEDGYLVVSLIAPPADFDAGIARVLARAARHPAP